MSHKPVKLLNSHGCERSELKRFCNNRHLQVLRNRARYKSKAALAKALTHADKERTFSRLLDLPRELRDLIYTFYVDGFGLEDGNYLQIVHKPTYPPLARVNRTLRDEVLPIYYEKICIQLRFMCRTSCYSRFQVNGMLQPCCFDRMSRGFLQSLPEDLLGKISRFKIDFDYLSFRDSEFTAWVNLRSVDGALELHDNWSEDLHRFPCIESSDLERFRSGIEEDFLKHIMEREDKRLKPHDIDNLSRALQHAGQFPHRNIDVPRADLIRI
jgi:hypothetical protein